ncbi:MAG: hypothetical protein AAF533_24070 [Acidobacteriota bacterium]
MTVSQKRSLACLLGLALIHAPVSAGVTSVVMVAAEGDPVAVGNLGNLNAPFTNGDGRVGFTFSLVAGGTGVWYDDGVRWLSIDADPDVLTGGESTMGIGNGGEFIYSPSINGGDGVWGELGLVLVENTPAPGFPAGVVTTFHSRPQMIDDGTAYWVAGFNETGGMSTEGRVLYRSRGAGPPEVVIRSDDLVDGLPVARTSGVSFDYDVSGDGAHRISILLLDDGTPNLEVVEVGGTTVAREGQPTGAGDFWENFDDVSINASGDYLFSGDTDGVTDTDEFLAYDAVIALREGDTVDGVVLDPGSTVQALSLNDLGQAVFTWRVGAVEHLFFAADASDLGASTVLLTVGDEVDSDGDGVADILVTDLTASGTVGPGLDLAEDGFLFVGIDFEPVGGGTEREAIVRFGLGVVPQPDQLYRSSVTDLSPGWQQRVPLPLTPASALDPGWPRPFVVPGTLDDLGVVAEGAPLVLYRLLDASGGGLGADLRVIRGPSPDDLQVSY